MSVNGNFTGGLEPPQPVRITTTTLTDILTATDNSQFVGAIGLCNESGSAVVTNLYYNDGSTDFMIFRRSLPADDTVILTDLPIRLIDGDKIKAQLETASREVTVTPIVLRSFPNEAMVG